MARSVRGCVAVVVSGALALGGCSLMMIDKPKRSQPRSESPRCSTGHGPIAADAVFATLYGILGIGLAAGDEGDGAAIPLLFGGLHALSAVGGRSWVRRCEEQYDAHDEYLREAALVPVGGSAPGTEVAGDFDDFDDEPRAPGFASAPEPAPAPAPAPEPAPEAAPEPASAPAPAPKPAPKTRPARKPAPKAPCADSTCFEAFWREVTP